MRRASSSDPTGRGVSRSISHPCGRYSQPTETGSVIRKRDHTTVMHGTEKIEHSLALLWRSVVARTQGACTISIDHRASQPRGAASGARSPDLRVSAAMQNA